MKEAQSRTLFGPRSGPRRFGADLVEETTCRDNWVV